MFTIEFVDESWERDSELASLLYEELYRDFGVAFDAEWRHENPGSSTAVALGRAGELLGTARLLPRAGDSARQVRQVAVARATRESGIGRALMCTLESRALEEGASEVWLYARDTAIEFYLRLGYEPYGEPFVSELTGIVHIGVRKSL